MLSDKNTPTRRALSVATMGANIAGSYIGYLLQRAFLGEAQGKSKLKSTHTRGPQDARRDAVAARAGDEDRTNVKLADGQPSRGSPRRIGDVANGSAGYAPLVGPCAG